MPNILDMFNSDFWDQKTSNSDPSHSSIMQNKSTLKDTSVSCTNIPPQWDHPFLHENRLFKLEELQSFSYDYYIKFTPFFKHQPQGSINGGVQIIFSSKMSSGLGLADIFERTIKLNSRYFTKDPTLIPYTLFHELTHIWLYDCYKDPSHTSSFYQKMKEFNSTLLPVDHKVHIHSRLVTDAKFIYVCPNCNRRWFTNKITRHIYCGLCKENFNLEFEPKYFKNPDNPHNKNYKLPYFQKPK